MFKINRKIEYALIALKYMSAKSPGQLTSAKEICDIYHTPFDSTSRVMQIMTQHSILKAEQGAHGGYQITRDLTKIPLSELTHIIIGPIEIADCMHGDYSQCDLVSSCSVIAPMLNLNEQIIKLFDTIMIADLLESKHTREKNIKQKPILNNLQEVKSIQNKSIPDPHQI